MHSDQRGSPRPVDAGAHLPGETSQLGRGAGQGARGVGAAARRPGCRLALGVVVGLCCAISLTGCAATAPSASGSSPSDPRSTVQVSPPPPSPVPASTAIGAPVRLSIPAIEVRASVVRLGLRRDGTLDVPTQAMAAGWYTGSPAPGSLGPAVIAGHVHWGGRPAIFAHLGELVPGDLVVVSGADQATATFRVDVVTTFPKDRFPTDLVYGHLDRAGLRLITCGGYDTTSRKYEANVIVFATLVTG